MSGKLLFTLSLVCLLSSCNSEIDNLDQPQVPAENRVVFESTSDFMKTFETLAYYNKNELKEWSESRQINSLLEECERNSLDRIPVPQAIQAMLNKNAEFQIKDSVIRYDNNNLYLVAVNQKELKNFVIIGHIHSNKLENSGLTKGYYEMGTSEIDGSNQEKFDVPGNKYEFKYVHELLAYKIDLSAATQYCLSLMLKLEYKGKKWHTAGEKRKLSMDLTTILDLVPIVTGDIKSTTCTDQLIEGNWEISLATYTYHNLVNIKQWNVNISGKIIEEVYGYPTTSWTDER